MKIWDKLLDLEKQNINFCIISLIDLRGSAPQDLGAKAVVTKSGLVFGTVGGGKVEAAAIVKAQEILNHQTLNPPLIIKWNLQTDIGMTCGGEVTFLFEHFIPLSWPIVIFGAGHIAQALTRTLSNLQCQITCIDSRSEWTEKLMNVKAITHPHPEQLVREFNKNTFFISMTKGHAFDVPVLKEIATHFPDCPYVGVIGSEIKGKRIKQELKELGISESFLRKLRVPIGLPLGSNDPFEIAISITAELLQVRDQQKCV
jgi:xanthine dehydrogenase accessory factor